MAHPIETALADAYAAFGRGDVNGYLSACAPDFTFHVPGHCRIAGDWVGADGMHALAAQVMTLTGGTFQEDVEAIFANDHNGVVLARHRFVRDGRQHDYRTAHVYDVRDGKLVCCYEQPRDPARFDEAWGAAALPR